VVVYIVVDEWRQYTLECQTDILSIARLIGTLNVNAMLIAVVALIALAWLYTTNITILRCLRDSLQMLTYKIIITRMR
jgi:hypothetical protein